MCAVGVLLDACTILDGYLAPRGSLKESITSCIPVNGSSTIHVRSGAIFRHLRDIFTLITFHISAFENQY